MKPNINWSELERLVKEENRFYDRWAHVRKNKTVQTGVVLIEYHKAVSEELTEINRGIISFCERYGITTEYARKFLKHNICIPQLRDLIERKYIHFDKIVSPTKKKSDFYVNFDKIVQIQNQIDVFIKDTGISEFEKNVVENLFITNTFILQWGGNSQIRAENFNHFLAKELERCITENPLSVKPQTSIVEKTVEKTVENTKKEATNMETKEKGTFKEEALKDLQSASVRLAVRQAIKLTRDPLVAVLERHIAPGDHVFRAKVADFLKTPLGGALVAALLSVGVGALPFKENKELIASMAREFRIEALAGSGDVLAEVFMAPLREVLTVLISANKDILPSLPQETEASKITEDLKEAITENVNSTQA